HNILEKWIPSEKQVRTPASWAVVSGESQGVFEGKRVEGIDFKAGMERYKDDAVYLNILRSYYSSIPETLPVVRDVSREDLSRYTVAVHGLKGVSRQICADGLGNHAEVLELAAKGEDWETITANNGAFLEEIGTLLQNLGEFLAGLEEKTEKIPAAAPDPVLLDKLLAACGEYNITVMEEALMELERYAYKSGGDLVPWLRSRLNDFDYDGIRNRLEEGDNGAKV
ncbi:MAG: hypothetical protein LBP32_02325, partial [Spirochaetaceae bacterium]|nr:hypothetical protein [Spirochaetaceae bacterium]